MDEGLRDSGTHAARVSSAAGFIIESIRRAGIDVVFGLPGVHALALWSAVERAGMRYIGFRHEQAAAHAADGYGRATGRPGVVLLSTGPGALNALSALAEAHVSSSPVLAISSAIPSGLIGRGKGYLHETKDLAPAFKAVTKFAGRAATVEDLSMLVPAALDAALGPPPGPSLIEVPVDLLDAELAREPLTGGGEEYALGADELIKINEAARLLNLAARPVVWAGGGVLRSDATTELLKVAESLDAPVITTFMGKGAIPENHPLSVGTLVRQPETAELLRNADVLLAVGTRFTAMATGNWKLELPSQLIHIDADRQQIGHNYPVRLGIATDARVALRTLHPEISRSAPSEPGAERAALVRDAAWSRARGEGPREMAFLEAIRSALEPEIVTVHDMTVPSYWSWPFFPVTVPGTFHSPYGYASLGFSFPAAIGVSAADTSRPVVAFSGDGGFQYHERELATLAQYSLPVTVIVFNDRAWGVLKAFAGARYSTDFGLELPGPDFVALAGAHGVRAARAEQPDELEKHLREALGSGEPNLIEVPGAWSLPPPAGYYR